MFYQFGENGLIKVKPEDVKSDVLTVGYVTDEELREIYERFGFAESTVKSCAKANSYFRSGVETYSDYTFTELKIFNDDEKKDDCVALYLKKNLLIVVDVKDEDGSTRDHLMTSLKRYSAADINLEKVLYAFFDAMVVGDVIKIEKTGILLSELEEMLLESEVAKDFNAKLLYQKKLLQRMLNYYEQILDITESIDENENGIFETDTLMYISNLTKRVERLREDINSLKSSVEHLQDSYSSYLDAKMNSTMKLFTVLTSIFFPLTIIVGWYGMNFQSMPEFTWKYGYVYVITLSIIVVAVLALIGKKKKWF